MILPSPSAGDARAFATSDVPPVVPPGISNYGAALFKQDQQATAHHTGGGGRSNPHAFASLPAGLVQDIGLWTHKGPCLDLAVLSALVYRDRRSRAEDNEWMRKILEADWVQGDPQLSGLLDLQPGMVWISREHVARDLRARWRFADREGLVFGSTINPTCLPWRQFFENVRNAFLRLEKAGHVRRLYDVQRTGKKRASMGSVFALDGTPIAEHLDALYTVRAAHALLLHPQAADTVLEQMLREAARSEAGDATPLPVVDLVGASLVAFTAFRAGGGAASAKAYREASPLVAVAAYDRAQTAKSIEAPRRWAHFKRWENRQAKRGPDGDVGPFAERHMSVGTWPKATPSDDRNAMLCTVPWIVLDFDRGGDVEEAFEAAQRATKAFLDLGVKANDLVCTYTGGRGFHVRLPAGTFGSPLFRDAAAAKAVLRGLAHALVDEDVDDAVLNPLHMARVVGSGYHAPPQNMSEAQASMLAPKRFEQRIPTEEFVGMMTAEAIAFGGRFEPTSLPDPRKADPVSACVYEAAHMGSPRAFYRAKSKEEKPGGGKTHAVRAVENGVAHGERNDAAYTMATYALDQGGMSSAEAWEYVKLWNAKNCPPLSAAELARVFTNAE